MRGQFRFKDLQTGEEEIVPNMLCSAGIESMLKQITKADVTDVASGGNFYIGICGATAAAADTIAQVTGEPAVSHGYSRKAVTRDGTGWTSIAQVNGIWRAATKTVTWTASGGDFSTSVNRLFMCNAASGTTGILYSYSAALVTARAIVSGNSYQAVYELYLE